MIATTAMIVGIRALDTESEMQLQNSLENLGVLLSGTFKINIPLKVFAKLDKIFIQIRINCQ
jgi:hypothetical protein